MKAKDLFNIILKIFGIYLIKDVIVSIPPVFKYFLEVIKFDPDVAVFSLIVSLLILSFYVLIVYFLLFRTGYIISKLNLTSDLSEEPMTTGMHRTTIYTIAIIVSGIVILAFAVPKLVMNIYYWYQFIDFNKEMYSTQSFDFSPIIIAISEVIVGLLFLGNQKLIVNYIELKSRKSNSD